MLIARSTRSPRGCADPTARPSSTTGAVAVDTVFITPEDAYEPPQHDHGTHVAGVLAANWVEMPPSGPGEPSLPTDKLMGICPDLQLWDMRVLGSQGEGDEFSVVAGLKLVEAINRRAGRLIIHGVNLSLALHHDVANYACGYTPVCNACRDLVDSGVVVVASAGNSGFNLRGVSSAYGSSYQNISITDQGNGQDVITVGSTHGSLPYQYGISYFSSRGPTADGRYKPDLLAPGEGINGPIPLINDVEADYKSYDGTSQAAAHVSGAAGMILARCPGMRGDPRAVKKALCESASDLGRERYFQGASPVDIVRALQSL